MKAIGCCILWLTLCLHGLDRGALGQSLSLRPLGFEAVEEIFVIGDLHADIHCAKQWLSRSKLVDLQSWTWTGPETSALVFLGDYVDRGPFGKQVLEFVRNLTVSFPRNVLAMMGNHDLYTLADAVLPSGATRFMGAAVKDFAYAFLHPEEYLNWIPEPEVQAEDLETLLPSLFAALQNVYAQNYEAEVMLQAGRRSQTIFDWPPLRFNRTLSTLLQQRLKKWQSWALEGLVTSGLAEWLAARPVAAVLAGVLLVHGGLPSWLTLRQIQQLGPGAVVNVDEFFSSGRKELLETLHEVVTYRGFHGRRGCKEVDQVLQLLKDDVQMIVVGHTAGKTVRQICGDRLVAADSSLSRFYRSYGNRYCPVRVVTERHGICSRQLSPCAGQAAHIRKGHVSLVNLDVNEEL